MAVDYTHTTDLLDRWRRERAELGPEPAPEPAPKSEQGFFGDLVDYAQRAFIRGFADDAELISLASEAAGGQAIADLAGDAADRLRARSEAAADTRSAAAREAEGLEFIHEDADGKYSFGDAWFDKDAWTRLAGEGLGSLASILATGGPLSGLLKAGAKRVGGTATLKSKIKDAVENDAKKLMAKGMSKDEAAQEVAKRVSALDAVAAKKLNAIDKLGTAVGYGAATGAQVGGATASGLQQMVENTSFEKLNNSPLYQQTYWDIKDKNPNLSIDQVHEQARKLVARELSKPAAAMGFALGAITGPVLGKYIDDVLAGKVAGGLMKRVAMGAGVEGGTEFVEEGGQQIAQNVAVQEVLPERRLLQGALPAAVEGGLGGAMAGGPTGLLSGRNIDAEKDVEAGMTPEQRVKTGVASKRLGVEIDNILAEGEAALEQQRKEVDNLLVGIGDAARGLLAQREELANIPFEQAVATDKKAKKKKGVAPADVNVYDSFATQQPTGFEPFFKPEMVPQPPAADEQAAALVPAAQEIGVTEALDEVNKAVEANTPVTPTMLDETIVANIKAKRPKPKKETYPKPAFPEAPAVEGLATAAPVAEGTQAPPTAGAVVSPKTAVTTEVQQPATTQAAPVQQSATPQPSAPTAPTAAPDVGTTMTTEEIDREAQDAGPAETENGHVVVQGLPITIETAAGQPRQKGWDPLVNHYGSIKRTKGAEGEEVDVFLGPNPESGTVFVVDQVKEDGTFDEHKAMVGFNSLKEARDAYQANYPKGWKGMGAITPMPAPQFKAWVDGGSKKPVNRAVPTGTVEAAQAAATPASFQTGAAPAAAPQGAQAAPQAAKPADLKSAFRLYVREKGAKGVAATQQLVESITSGWVVKPAGFKTIATFDEAPESTRNAHRRAQERGVADTPVAFLHEASPGRFEVYVVNDTLPSDPEKAAYEVAKSLYHEGVGHFGLRKMFGGRMDRVLAEAGRLYKDKLADKAKQYGLDLTDDKQRSKAMDEFIAELMEDPANRQLPIVRRVLAAIRETLRPIVKAITGRDLELTDDEIIRDFVVPARNLVLTGRAGTMADRRRVLSKYNAATGPERSVQRAAPPRDSAFKLTEKQKQDDIAEQNRILKGEELEDAVMELETAISEEFPAGWEAIKKMVPKAKTKAAFFGLVEFVRGMGGKDAVRAAKRAHGTLTESFNYHSDPKKAKQQMLLQTGNDTLGGSPLTKKEQKRAKAKVKVPKTKGAQRYELTQAQREANFLNWFGDSKMFDEPFDEEPSRHNILLDIESDSDPLMLAEKYQYDILEAQGVPGGIREETWDGYSEQDKVLGLETLAEQLEEMEKNKSERKTGMKARGGVAQIWYHGTAALFDIFQPKQAGAIFVTRNQEFAEAFAGMSRGKMLTNFEQFMSDDQIDRLRQIAINRMEAHLAKQGPLKIDYDPLVKKATELGYNVKEGSDGETYFTYHGDDDFDKSLTDLPTDDAIELSDAMQMRDAIRNGDVGSALRENEMALIMSDNPDRMRESRFFSEMLNHAISSSEKIKGVPVGFNIIPVYVRAENPFDYDNDEHRAALEKWLREANPKHVTDALGREFSIDSAMSELRTENNWQILEGREIQEAIKDMGHDGFFVSEYIPLPSGARTSEKNLAVYDPNQVKDVVGNNGYYSLEDPRHAFRLPGHRQSWDAPEITGWDKFIYLLQDKQVDAKRVVDAIRKATGILKDEQNVYEKETLYHGRTAARVDDFWSDELQPLLNDIHERGVKLPDFEKYLLARQAAETNAVLRTRNPHRVEPANGWSGMSDAQAAAYLGKLSAKDKRTYEALAARVDAVVEGTRKTLVEYGLETQETIDGWKKTFPNYIPLHREDMGDNMVIGQGFSVRGGSSKARTGSDKNVVNILANIAQQRDQAIIRGEKNIVANGLVALAKNNPNENFWRVDEPPTIKYIDNAGIARTMVDPNYRGRRNVITARTVETDANGDKVIREHSVVFNEQDERALRMSESLKNLDADQMSNLMSRWAKVTRYFASINTQYNPVFGVINLVRDVQSGLFNLSSTPLRGRQWAVTKLVPSALRGIMSDLRAVREGRHPTSQWAQEYEEFKREGAQTGYRDLFPTAKERDADQINAELKRLSNMEKGGAHFVYEKLLAPGTGAVWQWLSDYNTAMENAMRLAAYKTAKEMGMSKQTAANVAKNLTVNFNRKGQMGRQIGAMYAFFNASTQGTARIAQTLFKAPVDGTLKLELSDAGKKIITGGLMLGVMQSLVMAMYFDEDEPPEFVRQRNLIIPLTPFTDKKNYVSIPMPLGFHVIPNLSRVAMDAVLGGFKEMPERLVTVLDLMTDAFNPIGNAGLSMQTFTPTAADPLAALLENRDWTGKPITTPDYTPLKPEPAHMRTKDTATWYSKLFSEALNRLGGGTEYSAGVFSVTPDQFDFLFEQLTGGVGRELSKVAQTAESATTGEELPTHKIPLLGRLYGSAEGQSSQAGAFYANLKRAYKHELELKGRRTAGLDTVGYMRDNPEAKLWMLASKSERRVQELRRHKRKLVQSGADKERVRTVESLITDVMKNFNDRFKAEREGARE